jgi:hypothetical protein
MMKNLNFHPIKVQSVHTEMFSHLQMRKLESVQRENRYQKRVDYLTENKGKNIDIRI